MKFVNNYIFNLQSHRHGNHRHTRKCSSQPSYHLQMCPLILTELERLSLHELHVEGLRERCRRESKCIMHMHQFNAQKWSGEYFINLFCKCALTPSVCIVYIQSLYILYGTLRLYQHFRVFCLIPSNGMFLYTFCRVKWAPMLRHTKRILLWTSKVCWLISFNSSHCLKIKYINDFLSS